MEPVNVLALMSLTDEQASKLQMVSPKLAIHQHPDGAPETLPASLRDQVNVVFGSGPLIAAASELPQVRWVQVQYAGVDGLVDTPVWQSEIVITNASGIHAMPIAERTMAMILAFRARLPELWQYKQRREWPESTEIFKNAGLRGTTLGIAGYGAIGGELARQAAALGMRVLALNSRGQRRTMDTYLQPGIGDPQMQIPERMYAADALREMLPECDHVVALTPLTQQTWHMFDEAAFASMKPTALFYNFGRGGLVDEQALIAALKGGQIAGAGLDVFEQEPLPTDSPLWDMPNVIISPHVGGASEQYQDWATDLFAENLRRYVNDEPLLNVVDRQTGY